jgi:hypothetical protein
MMVVLFSNRGSESAMGTSFVEFRTKGFWVSDGLLEAWLYFLARQIDDIHDPDAWLSQLQQHWYRQSSGVGVGCIWAGLDDFVSTNERAAVIIDLNQRVLQRLDTYGATISKDELNTIPNEGAVWLEDLATDELKRVGRFFVRLLRGDLTTDAATSRGIAYDEQAAASKLGRLRLIELTQQIVKADGTAEEMSSWLEQMERSISLPEGYLSGLIFYPQQNGLGERPSAEEIVDRALSYRPIRL